MHIRAAFVIVRWCRQSVSLHSAWEVEVSIDRTGFGLGWLEVFLVCGGQLSFDRVDRCSSPKRVFELVA